MTPVTPTPSGRRPQGPRLLMGRTVPPHYRLVRQLPRGSQAIVWVAKHTPSEALVALKFFPDACDDKGAEHIAKAFQTEIVALQALASPHVVRARDQGVYDDTAFLVTDFVEGVSLGRWLADGERTFDAVFLIFRGLCAGVQAAHRLGITHGDLAPRNVIVRPDGTPVVLDFGMGALRNDQVLSRRAPDAYTPPELFTHELHPTFDVFALSVVLVELLSGLPEAPCNEPWRTVAEGGDDAVRSMLAGLELAAPLVEALVGGLCADPTRRHGDAQALLDAVMSATQRQELGRPKWPERDEMQAAVDEFERQEKALRAELSRVRSVLDGYAAEMRIALGLLLEQVRYYQARVYHHHHGGEPPSEPVPIEVTREQVMAGVAFEGLCREAKFEMHPDRLPTKTADEEKRLNGRFDDMIKAIKRGDEVKVRRLLTEHRVWLAERSERVLHLVAASAAEEIERLRRRHEELRNVVYDLERELNQTRTSRGFMEAQDWQRASARGEDFFASERTRLTLQRDSLRATWGEIEREKGDAGGGA